MRQNTILPEVLFLLVELLEVIGLEKEWPSYYFNYEFYTSEIYTWIRLCL